jgi:hypothetical protein
MKVKDAILHDFMKVIDVILQDILNWKLFKDFGVQKRPGGLA